MEDPFFWMSALFDNFFPFDFYISYFGPKIDNAAFLSHDLHNMHFRILT